jgi:hypothetical protein
VRDLRKLLTSAREFVRRHPHLRAPAAIALLAVLAGLLPASGLAREAGALDQALVVRRANVGSYLPPTPRTTAPLGPEQAPGPEVSTEPLPEADFIWPVDGWIVQGMWAGHPTGIDIGAYMGDTVRAIRAGTIVFAGGDPCCQYGYFVVIQHDEGWSSLYGHFGAITVRVGQQVEQGQPIGRVGTTGVSTGPHVHLELRSSGGVVDPLDYLYPHREAPPPDPADVAALAARRAQSAPVAPPPAPPTPTAQRHIDGLTAAQAAAYAANWLADQPNALYEVDPASCGASPRGPNWAVTCLGTPVGCFSTACATSLTACVYQQPFLISTSCP